MNVPFFFRVQSHQIEENQIYSPVPRKFIDIRIYDKQELLYSTIATQYIKQQKNNELVSEQKQQKLELQQAIRSQHQFPYPSQITYDGVDSELQNLNSQLSPSTTTQTLDSSNSVSTDFVAQFIALSSHIVENYSEHEESPEIIAYFAIASQLPPINDVGIAIRQVTKAVKIPPSISPFYDTKTSREMLLSLATRRWQGEDRYESLRRLFGIMKLFYHLKILKLDRIGEILCCLIGNSTLTFAESKRLLFEDQGVFSWILTYKAVDNALYRAGIYGKLLDGFDYFKSIIGPKTEEEEIAEAVSQTEIKLFLNVFKVILSSKAFKEKPVPFKQLAGALKSLKIIAQYIQDDKISEISGQIEKLIQKAKK